MLKKHGGASAPLLSSYSSILSNEEHGAKVHPCRSKIKALGISSSNYKWYFISHSVT
jgi:hypothetical protein